MESRKNFVEKEYFQSLVKDWGRDNKTASVGEFIRWMRWLFEC